MSETTKFILTGPLPALVIVGSFVAAMLCFPAFAFLVVAPVLIVGMHIVAIYCKIRGDNYRNSPDHPSKRKGASDG